MLAFRSSRSPVLLDTAGPRPPRRFTGNRSDRSSCTAPTWWIASSKTNLML